MGNGRIGARTEQRENKNEFQKCELVQRKGEVLGGNWIPGKVCVELSCTPSRGKPWESSICWEGMQQRGGETPELHWVSKSFHPNVRAVTWQAATADNWVQWVRSNPGMRLIPFCLICSVFTLFDIRDHEEPGHKALWHLLTNSLTQWHSIVKHMNTQFWTLLLLPGSTREMLHTFCLSGILYPWRNICPNGSGALGSCTSLKIRVNYTAPFQSSLWNGDSALKPLHCGGSHTS